MCRHLYIIFLLLFGASMVGAQIPSPTPFGVDKQNIAPDEIKGVPPIATDYQSNDRQLPDLGRVGVDMTLQKTLTLREAIELALENNRDIEVARKVMRMAEYDLDNARGVAQPRLTGQVYYDRTTIPNVSIFSSNQKTTNGTLLGNATVSASAPKNGTTFSAFFNNQRGTTDNPISILSPQLNSSLGVSVTQPLFRGRRTDPTRRAIEIAKRNIELTDTQFQQRSVETVATVEKAYWDLTFALRNLQVQRDAVRDSKSQVEHNRRLVNEGQLAPIDIVASETQVANFEQAVYEALNSVTATENALKLLLSVNRDSDLWGQSIVPVDPVEVAVPNATLTETLTLALSNRREIEINKSQRDINAIDQKFYKDQKKPQIDLVASFSENGIGGSSNPNFSPTFPTACTTDPNSPACAQQTANLALLTGSPLRGVFANRYPTFRVGVSFNIPLFGDKSAAASYGKALVDADRLEIQREQIEQAIQVEVRNAMQAVRTGEARLRAASVARENSTKQYESEQRKLDEGQSDVYKVQERQTALTVARSNELKARTDLNKAIAELERATGNSLSANDVQIMPRR